MESLNHDSSSEDSEHSTNISPERVQYIHYTNIVIAAIAVLHDSIREARPCMTSTNTGDKWIRELFAGHPSRFYNTFRMSQQIFTDLLWKLEHDYGLKGSQRTTAREVLGITLFILAQGRSIRSTCERFQHSSETISRYFSNGLRALIWLSIDVIKPIDPQFIDIPSEIRYDNRYMPFFKDCIGVIDGIHVDARIPVEDQVRYISHHGTTTQNVMAVCDFNMCFTFVFAGWEGSAHDSRIFARALLDRRLNFPHPPQGKYYLVDAEYPLKTGYLKPYPETRYHLEDYAHGNRPVQGRHEHFNKAHSSLRSVIERTFGIWKKKWHILQNMPQYSFQKQRSIVVATMALHNFIRRHPSCVDHDFRACDVDETFIHPNAYVHGRRRTQVNNTVEVDVDTDMFEDTSTNEMTTIRDSIAEELYNARR